MVFDENHTDTRVIYCFSLCVLSDVRLNSHITYPLVMTNIAIEHGPIEIVDLPMINQKWI